MKVRIARGSVFLLAGGLLAGCASNEATPAPRSRDHAPSTGAARDMDSLASPTAARAPAPRAPEKRYTIEVEDADLAEVVAELARRSGRKLAVAPDVHERVTISMRDLPLLTSDGILDTLAKMTKCEIEQRGDVTLLTQPRLVTLQDGGDCDVRTVLSMLAGYGGKSVVFVGDVKGTGEDVHEVPWDRAIRSLCAARGLFATRTGNVITVSSEPLAYGSLDLAGDDLPEAPLSRRDAHRGQAMDLDVKDASLADVLTTLSRFSGVPVVLRGECDQPITLALRDAPWRDVLDYLARAYRLKLREERGTILVSVPVRLTLQAGGASPATWFKLCAQAAGKGIVMPGHLEGSIDAELHGVTPLEALIATAHANGYEVLDARDGIVTVDRDR